MSKIKVKILKTPEDVANIVSSHIIALIKKNDLKNKKTVLCLPTGSTPIPVYERLISEFKRKKVSFKNVITFNLDEYFPMKKNHPQSYNYFMNDVFFKHIDIPKENIHIPTGELSQDEYEEYCEDYEKQINENGGLDLSLIGIGRTGHIGFNEPGSKRDDFTRLVVLHNKTRKDNSRFFETIAKVPKFAVTMGIGTILEKSKEIILIATGFHKSKIMKKTLENLRIIKTQCPASFLREHSNCSFVMDNAAGYRLKEFRYPWLVKNPVLFEWDEKIKKAAVIWLSKRIKKPILNLTEDDFCNNGLSSLFYKHEDNISLLVHSEQNFLLPDGKKNEKILIFSPHPDDDVFAIGGSIYQLSKRNKNIKICYMTSGSRSISIDDLKDHLRFTSLSLNDLNIKSGESNIGKILAGINDLKDEDDDSKLIQNLKTNVRKSEAINSIEKLGLKYDDAVFLDLPFYKTGKIKKKPKSVEDVNIVVKMLKDYQPDFIFCCSDLEDVHGTHSTCYYILKDALQQYKDYKKIFLYKGMWQEFSVTQTSVFVNLSKEDLDNKLVSILKHQSQLNKPLYPRDDKREFFIHARDRNFKTAKELKELGLPAYFACEAFQTADSLQDDIFSFV